MLERLRVWYLDVIQEDMRDILFSKLEIAVGKFFENERDEKLSILCIHEV